MVDKKNEKIHFLTYQRTVELYILCFLNKGLIKRKILEDYLLKGEQGKRVAFKDVYLPVLQHLDIPITETQLIDKGTGRYNPVFWQLDISALTDKFLSQYANYLENKSLKIEVPLNNLKTQLLIVFNAYESLCSTELQLLLEEKSFFPWQISILFMQVAILGLNIKELIQFLPIYLALSTKFSLINEASSINKELDTQWKTAIGSVPTYIDMINYYDALLIHELGKFFPITIRDFSQQIFKNIEEKNFRDHTNILYSLFRQQIDDEKDIAYVFNSPPPRDEGYWHLMVGIKETFMSKYPQNTNHALAKYLINLQKNNSAEYSSRTNLFFQIMLHSILVVFDEKFHLTKGQKFFFAELEQDKNSKVLFGLEVDK